MTDYAGSRYANDKTKGGALDAPDLAVRRALLKRENGQALSDKELNRLAQRMSVEKETNRAGGLVRQPITPKSIAPKPATPYDQGKADRQAEEGYAAGFEGREEGSPVRRAAPPANAAPIAPVRAPGGPMTLGGFTGTMRPSGAAAAVAQPATTSRKPVNPNDPDQLLRRQGNRSVTPRRLY